MSLCKTDFRLSFLCACSWVRKDTVMKSKHLTLDQRKSIQEGIENRLSKTAIARLIGKDPSTVAKEIKAHRKLKPRNRFNSSVICANFKGCSKPHRHCSEKCPQYVEQPVCCVTVPSAPAIIANASANADWIISSTTLLLLTKSTSFICPIPGRV